MLAIYSPVEQPTVTFDESQWADAIVDYVKENGKDAGPLEKYSASKALAEKGEQCMLDQDDEHESDVCFARQPLGNFTTLTNMKSNGIWSY